MILIGHYIGIIENRGGENGDHIRRRIHFRSSGNHIRPGQGNRLDLDPQLAEVVDEHQTDLALLFQTLDINIFQLESAVGVAGLCHIFFGLCEVLTIRLVL